MKVWGGEERRASPSGTLCQSAVAAIMQHQGPGGRGCSNQNTVFPVLEAMRVRPRSVPSTAFPHDLWMLPPRWVLIAVPAVSGPSLVTRI